jgi:molybdopterin-containing oxidoreductase family iron-sulfur binding subunit
MDAGSVDTLVILDSNPVYAAPGPLGFHDLLSRVRHSIHAGLYQDETALACDWHVPISHPLESWGDARAVDGTASIMQPVIAPLYSTRTTYWQCSRARSIRRPSR